MDINKKPYYESLPALLVEGHGIKCCHLNAKGERCDLYANLEVYEHEDIETSIHGGWHVAFYCFDHAKIRRKDIEDNNKNGN